MKNDISFNIIREVDSLAITKALIRRGFGYSLMGFGAVHEEVSRGELLASPMTGQEFCRSLTISRPSGSLITSAMTATIELISNIAEELVDTGKWRGIVYRQSRL